MSTARAKVAKGRAPRGRPATGHAPKSLILTTALALLRFDYAGCVAATSARLPPVRSS